MIEDQEGELEKNSNGILVFKTKTFGTVRSVNQNIPLGNYRITIRATRISEEDLFKNMKYCADVKEKVHNSGQEKDVIVGTGFASSSTNNSEKKTMKAFVSSSIKKGDLNTYFLWICDNHEKSIFTSKNHQLAVGHFFEGIFEEKANAKSKWQCIKYVNPINALLEGLMTGNKIELKTQISRYHPSSGREFPTVYAEHFGTIIDNKKKLPENCNGRYIKTQL